MPAYLFERDQLRQEIIRTAGGTISFWPKVPGTGAVSLFVDPDPGEFSYVVYDPDGAEIDSGTGVAADAGDGESDVFNVPIAAGLELDENYRVEFSWTWPADGIARANTVLFDVVRTPFSSEELVSLRELQELRPTIGHRLAQFGRLLGTLTVDNEAEEMASIFAANARGELEQKIHAAASQLGTTRARLILDRTRLARVERLITLALIFEGDAKGIVEEAEDESSQLARYYRAAAESAWAALGPLDYDSDEDGTPDEVVRPGNRVTFLKRVQG